MNEFIKDTLGLLVVIDVLMAFAVFVLGLVFYAFVRSLDKMPDIIAKQVRRTNSRRHTSTKERRAK